MEEASPPHHQTFRSPLLSTCVQTSTKLLVPSHLKSHYTALLLPVYLYFFLVDCIFLCQSPIDCMKRCFLPLWEPPP